MKQILALTLLSLTDRNPRPVPSISPLGESLGLPEGKRQARVTPYEAETCLETEALKVLAES